MTGVRVATHFQLRRPRRHQLVAAWERAQCGLCRMLGPGSEGAECDAILAFAGPAYTVSSEPGSGPMKFRAWR